MNKLALLFLLLASLHISAQSFRPGISLTYLYDSQADYIDVGQHQFTANVNFAYELTPWLNIGLQYLDIRTHGSAYNISNERQNYFIAGLFVQYDALPKWKGELFPELSINYGDFCPCGWTDPSKKAGIVYLGYGIGLDIPLKERLFLDLGLHYYRPLKNVEDQKRVYAYGGYIIGLSYRI